VHFNLQQQNTKRRNKPDGQPEYLLRRDADTISDFSAEAILAAATFKPPIQFQLQRS